MERCSDREMRVSIWPVVHITRTRNSPPTRGTAIRVNVGKRLFLEIPVRDYFIYVGDLELLKYNGNLASLVSSIGRSVRFSLPTFQALGPAAENGQFLATHMGQYINSRALWSLSASRTMLQGRVYNATEQNTSVKVNCGYRKQALPRERVYINYTLPNKEIPEDRMSCDCATERGICWDCACQLADELSSIPFRHDTAVHAGSAISAACILCFLMLEREHPLTHMCWLQGGSSTGPYSFNHEART